MRIPSDSYGCDIVGCCVLPEGQTLVADHRNKKVKLLNQQYQVVSHWAMTFPPEDMCQITPSEVAVAVNGYNGHVQFITVNRSQLATGRKLKLKHSCEGIAYHQGDLFICSGNALYQYSLSGKLVCRLYEDAEGPDTVYKCAVSPTGDKLFIISPENYQLLTLARDGTVLAKLKDLELLEPYGLHVTPVGQVLVIGFMSNTLIQVDCKGRRKLATLATRGRDGVAEPMSVCYNSSTSSIIVGQRPSDNIMVLKVDQCVHVSDMLITM